MYDPPGMMTRRHFLGYKPACSSAPPPLHVMSVNEDANHFPLPRVIAGGAHAGPAVVIGGTGLPCLGIDPTDPATHEGRGYRQCAGMIGRFNQRDDWLGIQPPGGQGVRPA